MEMEPILNKKPLDNLYEILSDINIYIGEHGSSRIPEQAVTELRKAINNLFTDYKIRNIYISDNTDKEFFGIFVIRRFDIHNLVESDIRDIPEDNMDSYDIDIDSKLFSMSMGFGTPDIASFILYDLYRILSHEATLEVAAAYDAICAGGRSTSNGNIIGSVAFTSLFRFCASDYLYRSRSIFTHNEDELIRVPQLLSSYELDGTFVNATEKLFNHDYMAGKKHNPHPALSLNWAISAMNRHVRKSTEILNVVNDFISFTGSTLIKTTMNFIAKELVRYNMKSRNIEVTKEASLFTSIRKNGLKSLENDLFEYEMRVKNIEDENSAIFLMRQINSRMSIIQDYLEEEKISEAEMKRWQRLYDRYEKLRVAMTNKPIYSRKMYGLFVDYNALMTQTNDNIMTMNTMY